jgi:hypothetical protein
MYDTLLDAAAPACCHGSYRLRQFARENCPGLVLLGKETLPQVYHFPMLVPVNHLKEPHVRNGGL